MAKSTVRYFCKSCGYDSAKWMGKCPACGEWNTFTEEKILPAASGKKRMVFEESPKAVPLQTIEGENLSRIATGIGELDRVLGGGLVPGSLVLLGGDPGIGKSTLLLQMAGNLAKAKHRVLYLSGEESLNQLRMRSLRLNVNEPELYASNDADLEHLSETLKKVDPEVVIIDSIQTVYLDTADGAQGSVVQLKECTARLMMMAKSSNRAYILIGHVTKEGNLAGPRMLEHMVDVVAYFEGERNYHYRILRGVKNRFGSTDEIGLFDMTGMGLLEVKDPAVVFLQNRGDVKEISGSVVAVSFEGTRPLLIEVQALVAEGAGQSYARRMAMGLDQNRLSLIIAVMEKRCGFRLGSSDVYLKITGGVFLKDPSADLAVAAAVLSSHQDRSWPSDTAFTGEIALSGEIRPIPFLEARIKETRKMGFKNLVLPKGLKERERAVAGNLNLIEVEDIYDLFQLFLKNAGNA